MINNAEDRLHFAKVLMSELKVCKQDVSFFSFFQFWSGMKTNNSRMLNEQNWGFLI